MFAASTKLLDYSAASPRPLCEAGAFLRLERGTNRAARTLTLAMNLRTSRLELIPATAELLRLEDGSPLALAIPLNAVIPIEWPPEEVRGVLGFFADQMDAGVTGDSWVNYCWIAHTTDGAPPVLVGSGGFKSKPVNGLVELGYGTLKQFQRQGYATEAVSALTPWGCLSQTSRGSPRTPCRRMRRRCGFWRKTALPKLGRARMRERGGLRSPRPFSAVSG